MAGYMSIDEHMIEALERSEERRGGNTMSTKSEEPMYAKCFNEAAKHCGSDAMFEEMRVNHLSQKVIYFEGTLSAKERTVIVNDMAATLKINPCWIKLVGFYS